MGFFDDIGLGFVEDAADAVVDVVDDVVGGVSDAVSSIPVVGDVIDAAGEVVGGVADVVSSIPIVGDVVGAAAPFAGMLGTFVGGPVGGMIGGAIGSAFGDSGGGPFDIIDGAIGAVGGMLPGPIADVAGGLLGGGSLIDAAGSLLSGGVPGLGDLAGSIPGLGDLAGSIPGLGDLAGSIPGLGDLAGSIPGLGDLAGNIPGLGDLAGSIPGLGDLADSIPGLGDLGGIAGGLLGGDGVPDLGGILGQAGDLLGGLGLGGLGSAATGIIGDVVPGLSDAGGWLDNFPSSLPDVLPDSMPWGGCGTFPTPDLTGPIGEAGGGWLGHLGQMAEDVTAGLPGLGGTGGFFGQIQEQLNTVQEQLGIIINGADGPLGAATDAAGAAASDFSTNIDDLIGQLPGVAEGGSVQDKLQSLAETGGLGDALGNMSSNELTQLVSHLVSPVESVTDRFDDVIAPATSGLADEMVGDEGFDLPGTAAGASDDMLGIGADDLGELGELGGLGGPDTMPEAVGTQADAGIGDDMGLDTPVDGGAVGGGGADFTSPEVPDLAPEPEPVSDFSQGMAQADAVEQSFDDMFEGLE